MEKGIGASFSSRNKTQIDFLEQKLNPLGIKLLRYETQLRVQDSIKSFMEKMGQLDKNFILLSRDYLASPFCIYELSKLVQVPDKLIIIYADSTDVGILLENATTYWGSNRKNSVKWLEEELIKLDFDRLFRQFSEILINRYISYDEISSAHGQRQILEVLHYTPDVYVNELTSIVDLENFYKREMAFAKYLKAAPDNEVFRYYKALSFEKQGYIDGASFFLNQAVALNPRYIVAYIKLFDLAIKYPDIVSLDGGIFELLDNMTKISLKDKTVIAKAKGLFLFRLAQQSKQEDGPQSRKDLLRMSLECYQDASKLCGRKDAVIFNNIGQIYEILGEVSKAADSYVEAIKLSPQYYQALNNLALLYHKFSRDLQFAKQLYEHCLEIKPDYNIARNNYALLMEELEPKAAAAVYFQLLCAPHTRTDCITNLALVLEEDGISREIAGILYQNALEKQPQSLVTQFNMGNYLRRKGAPYQEVVKYLAPVERDLPENDMVLLTLSLLHLRENHIETAYEYCEKTLIQNPQYIPALFLQGYLMERLGEKPGTIIPKIEEMLRDMQANNHAEYRFALLYNLLAILYLKMGDDNKCREWHEMAYDGDERFHKAMTADKLDYGLDVLERDYPRVSAGRIYKNRVLNISLDDKEQILLHLQRMIDTSENS